MQIVRHMKKTLPLILLFFVAFPLIGSTTDCRVEYTYKKGKNPDGLYPGGIGQPMTGRDEFVIYKKCKNFCFEKNSNNYPHINNISCYIDKTPLENSKFKTIYKKHKKQICHITVYKNGKKLNSHYIDLAKNESACKKSITTKHWCKIGYECKYTYGTW